MPNPILLKRNSTSGAVPAAASLSVGELAVNTADGRVFTKLTNDWVVPVSGMFRSAVSYSGSSTPPDLVANMGCVIRTLPTIHGSFTTPTAIITVPSHTTAPIPIGAAYLFVQTTAGTVTFAGDSGVALRSYSGLTMAGINSTAMLIKNNTNNWLLFGDLVPSSNAALASTTNVLHLTTANQIPTASQLETGQLAVNSADGVLYTKLAGNAIARVTFSLVGGSGSWTTTSSYTGSNTDIDLQNRINHKVAVTPGLVTPFAGDVARIRIYNNATVPIAIGSRIWLEQVAVATGSAGVFISVNTGDITLTLPAGKSSTLSGLGALVMMEKTAVNTWNITGDLADA